MDVWLAVLAAGTRPVAAWPARTAIWASMVEGARVQSRAAVRVQVMAGMLNTWITLSLLGLGGVWVQSPVRVWTAPGTEDRGKGCGPRCGCGGRRGPRLVLAWLYCSFPVLQCPPLVPRVSVGRFRVGFWLKKPWGSSMKPMFWPGHHGPVFETDDVVHAEGVPDHEVPHPRCSGPFSVQICRPSSAPVDWFGNSPAAKRSVRSYAVTQRLFRANWARLET